MLKRFGVPQFWRYAAEAGGLRSVHSGSNLHKFKKIGTIGMGLMGHGIAQTAAAAGFDVVAMDMDEHQLTSGIQRIEGSMQKLLAHQVQKQKLTELEAHGKLEQTMQRIHPTTKLEDVAECDLVIEAIVENVKVKKQFYAKLGKIAMPSTIFASNTSSLAISDFAEASERPKQVVGLHFFNPVQLMKLVEVIRTDMTDPEVVTACRKFATALGKHPVTCKDTPGFIVNRLLLPSLAQAITMYEKDIASKEDIDVAMQLGAAHPMGPFTLADYVGLDTCLFVLDGWVKRYPNEPAFYVPDMLRDKVAQGKLGRKSGEGFYKWDGDKRVDEAKH